MHETLPSYRSHAVLLERREPSGETSLIAQAAWEANLLARLRISSQMGCKCLPDYWCAGLVGFRSRVFER